MSSLRNFPHVINKIVELWGEPCGLENYIMGIMMMDRETREGFPPHVFSELYAVLHTHQLLFGTREQVADTCRLPV